MAIKLALAAASALVLAGCLQGAAGRAPDHTLRDSLAFGPWQEASKSYRIAIPSAIHNMTVASAYTFPGETHIDACVGPGPDDCMELLLLPPQGTNATRHLWWFRFPPTGAGAVLDFRVTTKGAVGVAGEAPFAFEFFYNTHPSEVR